MRDQTARSLLVGAVLGAVIVLLVNFFGSRVLERAFSTEDIIATQKWLFASYPATTNSFGSKGYIVILQLNNTSNSLSKEIKIITATAVRLGFQTDYPSQRISDKEIKFNPLLPNRKVDVTLFTDEHYESPYYKPDIVILHNEKRIIPKMLTYEENNSPTGLVPVLFGNPFCEVIVACLTALGGLIVILMGFTALVQQNQKLRVQAITKQKFEEMLQDIEYARVHFPEKLPNQSMNEARVQ